MSYAAFSMTSRVGRLDAPVAGLRGRTRSRSQVEQKPIAAARSSARAGCPGCTAGTDRRRGRDSRGPRHLGPVGQLDDRIELGPDRQLVIGRRLPEAVQRGPGEQLGPAHRVEKCSIGTPSPCQRRARRCRTTARNARPLAESLATAFECGIGLPQHRGCNHHGAHA